MLKTFVNSFRVPEIRKKLAFTAAMLMVYRFGAHIPAPGIDIAVLDDIKSSFNDGGALGLLNLVSGGSLQNFAVFPLGGGPSLTDPHILHPPPVARRSRR